MKKILFISYANENLDKVNLIRKSLANHPLFEVLVVAFKREPNKTLVKKVTDGIDSSAAIIPILTSDSIEASNS